MTEKTILITGCSSGIGLAAAIMLKARGYRVFAAARQISDIKALAAKGFESIQLDLNKTESIHSAVGEILERTQGKLAAVFNNAGFLQVGAIEDLSQEAIKSQFQTNVFGTMELTQLVLPIMRQQGYGRIIQNSSILGLITVPFYGAYSASKFALEGFSNTLRQELRGTDIHVSIINPGPINTHLRANAFLQYQQKLNRKKTSLHEEAYQKLEKTYFNPNIKNQSIALNPEAVVKKLILALESKHPKGHYYVGTAAHLLALLRRLLPEKVLDWILCNIN